MCRYKRLVAHFHFERCQYLLVDVAVQEVVDASYSKEIVSAEELTQEKTPKNS